MAAIDSRQPVGRVDSSRRDRSLPLTTTNVSTAQDTRILVVVQGWLGDVVMAQSLLQLLRERRPAAAIDVLVPAGFEGIVERMPEVRRAVPLPVRHGELGLGTRLRVARALRAEGYDWAIVLPRSLKAALVPCFARIPRRTGFRASLRGGWLNDLRPLDRARLDQSVKRFAALGLAPGEELPPLAHPRLSVDEANLARLCERLDLATCRPVVALVPGAAYGPAKRWPAEHFAGLARALLAADAAVWILGSPDERELGEAIRAGGAGGADGAGGARNLCGETDLADAVDLLAATRCTVANDSGLMHVAAAVGTHVVALYGSSSPANTPPLAERATVLTLGLDCSPCFERVCPLGHLDCLRKLEPARVAAAVREALAAADR